MRVLRSRKGQASIMIAMMTVTFGFFFVFVVSTGLLVSAKINLQNAADMAAYAGAAVQARQLNQISFLNYEMRRQYKKFLFRYYVIGTKSYRDEPVQGPDRYWSLSGDYSKRFGVPAVCVTFNQKSNHCQVAELRPIKPPPINPLDSVSAALNAQLTELEKIRQDQCGKSWYTNRLLLTLWLFNTDPSLQSIKDEMASLPATQDNLETRLVLETVQKFGQGLGLVPREALISQRILSLQDFVNAPAQKGLTYDGVQQFRLSRNVVKLERPTQAFLSAYYTLGSGERNDTFPGDEIKLTELLPDTMLKLEPLKSSFESYFTYFQIAAAGTAAPGTCLPYPVAFRVRDVPVGFYKVPNLLTYYGVRLDASLNLLFKRTMFPGLSFSLKLRAYSAAQPFGSRIGPGQSLIKNEDFRKVGVAPNFPGVTGVAIDPCNGGCLGIPDLRLLKRGTSTGSGGYSDRQVFSALDNLVGSAGGTIQDNPEMYYRAMYPNPEEEGKYNIINDQSLGNASTDEKRVNFVQYFPRDKSETNQQDPVYSFYAPIIPPDNPADPARVISDLIDQSLSGVSSVGIGDLGDVKADGLKQSLKKGLSAYFGQLQGGGGEEGEGNFIARIRNPFRGEAVGNSWPPLSPPGIVALDRARYVQTLNNSWVTSKNNAILGVGRLGYSVKYVSFKLLRSGGGGNVTSDGLEGWSNSEPSLDAESGADLDSLFH